MAAGGPGDHPLTDILLWGLHPLTREVSAIVTELATLMSEEELLNAIVWLPPPSPQSALAQLQRLLRQRRIDAATRGWDGHASRDRKADLARAEEIRLAIRRILLEAWNPIGLEESDGRQDEYDAYIGPLYRLIAAGEGPARLAEALAEAERGMGLSTPMDSLLPLGARLARLDVRLRPS
jgi:hypothetical protein